MDKEEEPFDAATYSPRRLFVYIIAADEVRRCKVGVTSKARLYGATRLGDLQTQCPVLLRVHKEYEAPCYLARAAEREVLETLDAIRLFGEWLGCEATSVSELVEERLAASRDWPKENWRLARVVLSGYDDWRTDFHAKRLMDLGFTAPQAAEAMGAYQKRRAARINKSSSPSSPRQNVSQTPRNAEIVAALRARTETLSEIGRRHGLTRERVRQIGNAFGLRSEAEPRSRGGRLKRPPPRLFFEEEATPFGK